MVKHTSTRHDRSFWRRAVAAAELGDASHADVAARFGVRVATLRAWIYQFRREQRASPTHEPVQVLPVALPATAPTTAIELRIGEIEIRLAPDTTPDALAAFIRALRSTAC